MTKCFNEAKKWTTKCKILTQKAERITSVSLSVSPVSKALISKRVKKGLLNARYRQTQFFFYRYTFSKALMVMVGRPAGAKVCAIWGGNFGNYLSNSGTQKGVPHKPDKLFFLVPVFPIGSVKIYQKS